MIKRWNKFNESVDGRFTEEMAMEIVYYFSENSKPNKEIEKLFFENPETSNLFDFYEAGHKEYKSATQKFFDMVNRGSLEFRKIVFQVYNRIREERKDFPPMAEVEDIFLDVVDDGYSFIVYTNDYEYKVIMEKYDDTLDKFVKYAKLLGERANRFNTGKLKCTLSKAQRLNGFYNQKNEGKDKYELNEFEVIFRRSGFQLITRTGNWEPE